MDSAHAKLRYSAPIIVLHWLMFVLVAASFALMELKTFAPRGSDLRGNMAVLHYAFGLIVFALTGVRLVLRLGAVVPSIEPALPVWQARIAKILHGLLYAFMIILPVLGWLALSAKGRPVHLFFFDLPFPVEPDDDLARQLKQLHETIAKVGYFLIGLHAAAALFHHYVRRDDTLERMLPRRSSGRKLRAIEGKSP